MNQKRYDLGCNPLDRRYLNTSRPLSLKFNFINLNAKTAERGNDIGENTRSEQHVGLTERGRTSSLLHSIYENYQKIAKLLAVLEKCPC